MASDSNLTREEQREYQRLLHKVLHQEKISSREIDRYMALDMRRNAVAR